MTDKNYITAVCSVKNGTVKINNTFDFTNSLVTSGVDFLKSVYTHYQFNYPKFFKMDGLCKLAFTASELVLKQNNITNTYKPEDIAIIIANRTSSLETDSEHQHAISNKENYFPSPSVFVYTLPNIMIGEIAIRNKITGENSVFIFDKFDAEFMSEYVNSLLNSNKAQCCITGWVDFYDNKYEAFLITVEKKKSALGIENQTEELNKLFITNA